MVSFKVSVLFVVAALLLLQQVAANPWIGGGFIGGPFGVSYLILQQSRNFCSS